MLRTLTLHLTVLHLISVAGWAGSSRAAAGPAPGEDGFNRFRNLPPGWMIAKPARSSSRDFGGQSVFIVNTMLTVEDQPLQVNTIACQTEEGAVEAQETVLRAHRGVHERCPREGRVVFEFVGKDMRLIERAYLELGFKPPKVTYDASFHAAPIGKCDYMLWNKMFNAFLAAEPNEVAIRELAKGVTFGRQIRIRNHGLGSAASLFAFSPDALSTKPDADGDLTAHTFAELPQKHGVPQVAVEAVVTSEAFAMTPSSRKAGKELLGATEFWPAEDPQIVALANRITGQRNDTAAKVAALLAWFVPARNIHYAGDVMGSRDGVKTVLKQASGRCWDFSDCFVTLCRAAGVPSRQVFGWMYGESGHVWAEVLLEGRGWRQVDPTAGMGCDSRYVPFIASEDGAMPIVYTSAVRIAPRVASDTRR